MRTLGIITILILAIFTLHPFSEGRAMNDNEETKQAEAIFAGGCFWCMESDFEHIEGINAVLSGYTGGTVANPEYKQVSRGGTGHYEAIKILYNPDKISYKELLSHFWHNVDPFNADGQFCDYGDQYRAAIFYANDQEKEQAETSKEAAQKQFKEQIVTEIIPASTFYDAEEYHQDYYLKSASKYKFYRWRCGRDKRLNQIWGTDRNEKAPFEYYKND